MKSAVLNELNYQFKIKVNMKTKTSILALTKAFFILLVSCCLFSCSIEPQKKQELTKRNYTVRLSNWVGSDYYECDSVIWITDSHFKLKNKESKVPFMDIIVPKEVVVRISLNSN